MHLRLSRILLATLATAALAVSAPALAVAFPLDRPAPEKRPTLVVAVRYASQVASVRAAAERAGGHVDEQYRWNALLVSLPAGADTAGLEAAVRGVAGVRYAQRPTIVHATATATNDPVFPLQWGTRRIGADAAWDLTQGEGVAIAEIDTGVDYTHRDLVGRVVSYHDYVNNDSDAMDDDPQTHGTHVAGILAATRNNGLDIAGTAPLATVYAFKVLDSNGDGSTADAASAIRDAVDYTSCRIITMSFGAAGANDQVLGDAIAYARSAGKLVLAAAGNDGSSSTRFYPAAFPGVVGVGAIDSHDGRASFSNFAPNLVDLVAPGVGIYSTVSLSSGAKTAAYSGTSMATPYAAAAAALVMARYPSLDATEVLDLLQATATDLGAAGRDNSFGHGLVRADLAVQGGSPDIYEPDDTAVTGSTAVLGASYAHSLYPVGDTDFHQVVLIAGRTYTVETSSLRIGADTALDLLATDATTVVAANDDRSPGDRASSITYTAPASGTYYLRVTDPRSLGGLYTVRVTDLTAALSVTRLAGSTRYDAAVHIAKTAYPGWAGVTDIVLASGEDAAAADPLSAAGLCNLYRAPLLLTAGAKLSPEVVAAIAEMPAPVTVHIVGGTGSVGSAVEKSLARLRPVFAVERIAGADRYAMAANVAERMRTEASVPPTVALVVNGADPRTFFDALALSAVSSHRGFPILLVKQGSVPAATAAELGVLAPSEVRVAGGGGSVSNAVYSAVHGSGRWWGATRYDTARAVANGAISRGWLSPDYAAVAAVLPDALSGGAALGSLGAPVLVTGPNALSGPAREFLFANRASLRAVYVLGGTGSVSSAVQSSIVRALQ